MMIYAVFMAIMVLIGFVINIFIISEDSENAKIMSIILLGFTVFVSLLFWAEYLTRIGVI